MTVLFANNAVSTLASGISDSATTIDIQSADASLFPAPGADEWYPVTLTDGAGNMEIAHVTARASAALTVTRGEEGTTAIAFDAGSPIAMRLTEEALEALLQKAANLADLTDATEARANLGADGNFKTVQVFTSSGTWTRPAGCVGVRIIAVGGGGGGGGVAAGGSGSAGGGGGHSGAFAVRPYLDVTAIASATISIGALGGGGAAGANDGSTGGNTVWNDGVNTFTWGGGGGGGSNTSNSSAGVKMINSPGSVTGTGLYGGGWRGQPAFRGLLQVGRAASGAGTPFGIGGLGGDSSTPSSGGHASGYGAGGGGGFTTTSADRAGGNGAPGLMIVEEFY